MSLSGEESQAKAPLKRLLPQKRRWRALLLILSLTGLAAIWAWMSREQIASNLIESELTALGIPAGYEIVSIGPQEQRLRNLVIGDPKRPDLTIKEVIVDLDYGLWGPAIGTVTVIEPRLYGTIDKNGTLSFGALDPLFFAESEEPAALPALDLKLVDGRGRIDTPYGAIGVMVEGAGRLDDGFDGTLAATAPELGREGCRVQQASLYGDLTTSSGLPKLTGPIRLTGLDCEGGRVDSANIGAQIALTDDLATLGGDLVFDVAQLSFADAISEALTGKARFSINENGLTLTHDLAVVDFRSPLGTIARFEADGAYRAENDFAHSEWDGTIDATGADLSRAIGSNLQSAREAGEGTLLAPLLAKLERNLAGAMRGGGASAQVTLRQRDDATTLIIPEASITSRSGERVLALSRVNWLIHSKQAPASASGNFIAGGEGLPLINGRMEQDAGKPLSLRLSMAEYEADGSSIAVPMLQIRESGAGYALSGRIIASGALPGGTVSGLELPFDGSWSNRAGLALGRTCSTIRFEALALYDFALGAQEIELCPQAGEAILAYSDVLKLAAETGEIAIEGRLGESPVQLRADGAQLRYPGPFALSNVSAVIGEAESAARFSAANLAGIFGQDISGSFAGGIAALDVVPMDLAELSGIWAFSDGALLIDEAAFSLSERSSEQARFEPLIARGSSLMLADGMIMADTDLRHPKSDRIVANVAVLHELSSGQGSAQLSVPGLLFDGELQPGDLSFYASGVVELAEGIVTGEGQIAWSSDAVTSGGTFSTDGIDFAAAFGPVRKARGSITFTDLLSLTTAPGQRLDIASVNTGIEVLDGTLRYSISDGQLFALEGASWPFMGGMLELRPVVLDFSIPRERRYTLEIIGLDAQTFVAQMEFGNLSASGTFDGTIPLIFDEDGNGRIEAGMLISRPPGGNVSYVGELTYEDAGAIANFAFDALRSLNYTQMAVTMDGNLTGEIITSVRFDGVSQGEGASSNFLTRQIAKLPIRFNVNVRSEFFELTQVLRSMYDATYLRDPCLETSSAFRDQEFYRAVCKGREYTAPEDMPFDESAIQAQESEESP